MVDERNQPADTLARPLHAGTMSPSFTALVGPSIRRISVAYLGPKGTYSHQAARAVFAKFTAQDAFSIPDTSEVSEVPSASTSGDQGKAQNGSASKGPEKKRRKVEVSYIPCSTITEAFQFATADPSSSIIPIDSSPASDGVKKASGDADSAGEATGDDDERYVVIPVVNSSNGPVKESMACFGLTLQDEPPPRIRMQDSKTRRRRKMSAEQKEVEQEDIDPGASKDFLAEVKNDTQIRVVAGTELAVSHALLLSAEDYERLKGRSSEGEDGRPAKKRTKIENGDGQEQSTDAKEADEELALESFAAITEVASHEQVGN